MNNKSHWFEQALIAFVVVSVCLPVIGAVLPHLVIPVIVIGAVLIVVRIVFHHTRPW